MAYAQKIDGTWTALADGQTVQHEDVVASYETVTSWTKREREAFGVFEIMDGDPPPEGQRVVSSTIGERDGKPVWLVTLEPIPPVVVDVVTMRQAKLALRRSGVLAKADAAIAGMAGEAGEDARIEWQYASELRRDHPLVGGIGDALGLDEAAIDTLFAQAAAIP